jgi:hypothetical protein
MILIQNTFITAEVNNSNESKIDCFRAEILSMTTWIWKSKFNSIQFPIIYLPSQQPQGQLQTQHSVDTSNYIMDKHNIKSKTT